MAEVERFINTASTAGGDGTTNNTSGGDRAYASFTEWESDEQTDLVSDGDTHQVFCSGGNDNHTSTRFISGWTTGASNFVTMSGNSGDEHKGVPGANYVFRYNGTLGVNVFIPGENFSVIEDIEFRNDTSATSGNARCVDSLSGDDVIVRRCIFNLRNIGAVGPMVGIRVNNQQNWSIQSCLTWVSSGTGDACVSLELSNDVGGAVIANNTFWAGGTVDVGYAGNGGAVTPDPVFNNNVFYGATAACQPDTDYSEDGSYNAGNDSSIFGTNIVSTTLTDAAFEDVDNDDYRPAVGSVLINAGDGANAPTLGIDLIPFGTTTSGCMVGCFADPKVITRYINPASATGGTGRLSTTTGGDRAHHEFSDWESNEQMDLVGGLGYNHEVLCVAGSLATANLATVLSWTTDATHFVTIKANPGDEHKGVPGVGFRAHNTNTTVAQRVLSVLDEYVVIQDIEFDDINRSDTFYSILDVGDLVEGVRGQFGTYRRLLFTPDPSPAGTIQCLVLHVSADGCVIEGCAVIAGAPTVTLWNANALDTIIRNCTFWGATSDMIDVSGNNFVQVYNTVTENADLQAGGFSKLSTHNAKSSTGPAPNDLDWQNTVSASIVDADFVDFANDDLRPNTDPANDPVSPLFGRGHPDHLPSDGLGIDLIAFDTAHPNIGAWAGPALVKRFINPAASAGGDGTTPGTSGSNRAYGGMVEWEADEQADLVTAEQLHIVECVAGTDSFSSALQIQGWTCDITFNLRIHAFPGDEALGRLGAGYIARYTGTSNGYGFRVQETFTTLQDIELRDRTNYGFGGSLEFLDASADPSYYKRLVLTADNIGGNFIHMIDPSQGCHFESILFYVIDGNPGLGHTWVNSAGTGTGAFFLNCTGWDSDNEEGIRTGGTVPLTVHNNAINGGGGGGDFLDLGADLTGEENASSDLTADTGIVGSNFYTSVADSAFRDVANDDFRLTIDGVLWEGGSDGDAPSFGIDLHPFPATNPHVGAFAGNRPPVVRAINANYRRFTPHIGR